MVTVLDAAYIVLLTYRLRTFDEQSAAAQYADDGLVEALEMSEVAD